MKAAHEIALGLISWRWIAFFSFFDWPWILFRNVKFLLNENLIFKITKENSRYADYDFFPIVPDLILKYN